MFHVQNIAEKTKKGNRKMKKTEKRQEKGIKYCLFQEQNEKMTKTWQVCEEIMKKINYFQIVVHRGI